MITSIAITIISAALFLYWFRYTCLLILNAETTTDYAGDVASANGLSFRRIQSLLATAASADLDRLNQSLERDFNMVAYLMRHAGDLQVGGGSVEGLMLRVDYRVMKAWYRVSQSRAALQEMCRIVAYFANSMGEREACPSEIAA
jgi:hypothetical protein